MDNVKKLYVFTILSILVTLVVWFIILDFSRFFNLNYSYDIFPSAVLKRICVILAAAITWSVGRDGLNPRDSIIIGAAFLFACLGEGAFAIGERIIGVEMFAVCQTLLIIRHSAGFRYKLAHAGYRQKKRLFASGMVILLIFAVFVVMFGSTIKSGSTAIVILLYGALLGTSLWAGLACYILELLPAINSSLAAAGMLCFFCCDVLVGLDTVMKTGIIWLIVNSMIWIFYIPALVLLALSSYRYNNRSLKY